MKANILLNRDAWPRQTPCIHPEDHAWLVGTWLEPGRLLMPVRALSGGQDNYIRFDNVIFGEALKCVTAKSATTWGDVQAEISKAPPPDMLPVPYVLVVRSTRLGALVQPGVYGRQNSAPPSSTAIPNNMTLLIVDPIDGNRELLGTKTFDALAKNLASGNPLSAFSCYCEGL